MSSQSEAVKNLHRVWGHPDACSNRSQGIGSFVNLWLDPDLPERNPKRQPCNSCTDDERRLG
jgi:hypothetical protein